MRRAVAILPEEITETAEVEKIINSLRRYIPAESIQAWIPGEMPEGVVHLNCGKIVNILAKNGMAPSGRQKADAVWQLTERERPDLIIFPEFSGGNEAAVRLAVRGGLRCLTDVREFEWKDGNFTARKFVYNANLTADFELELPATLTYSPELDEEVPQCGGSPEIEKFFVSSCTEDWLMKEEFIPAESGDELSEARFVVVCGNGVGSRETAASAEAVASTLGAVTAGTRPAVINGWIPPERLIGISGSEISPELCIVLGASGAQTFAAGIRKSRLIISVNSDPDARIFRASDVGVCCDSTEFIQELSRIVKGEEQTKVENGTRDQESSF